MNAKAKKPTKDDIKRLERLSERLDRREKFHKEQGHTLMNGSARAVDIKDSAAIKKVINFLRFQQSEIDRLSKDQAVSI